MKSRQKLFASLGNLNSPEMAKQTLAYLLDSSQPLDHVIAE